MPPSILSPKPRVPMNHYVISAPVQGSFTQLSYSPPKGDKDRSSPPDIDFPATHKRLMDKLAIMKTLKLDRRSPSISGPVEGSFRHLGHMEYSEEEGFMMQGLDSSLQAEVEHLSDIGAHPATPRRVRRSSEPENFPLDDTGVSGLRERRQFTSQLKSAPAELDQPHGHQFYQSHHRPTQSYDPSVRVGRTGAAVELRPWQASDLHWPRRSPSQKAITLAPHISRSSSATTARMVYPAQENAYKALASSSLDQFQQSPPSRTENINVREPEVDVTRHQDYTVSELHRQRCKSESVSHVHARTLETNEHRNPDGGSRRRVVHRKAVPKLYTDESNSQISVTDSPRRRADPKGDRPRPAARYFEESSIDALFGPASPSSAPISGEKRDEEVQKWRKEMQRKSEIYEQQHNEDSENVPPLPLTATLSVRDRVMRLIKAALEHESTSELSLLCEDEAQLAIDTVWEMLSMPTPAEFISSSTEHSKPHRVKRAILRRLSLKLVLQYDRMPAALFLSGVRCHDREASVGGGNADVYCGTFGNMKVALKCLRAFKMSSTSAKIGLKRAFYRESLLWQDLAHPHIVPFLGVAEGVFKHSVCMVLPWLQNGSILNYMEFKKEDGALTPENHDVVINEWCFETAQGLAYLHEEGIVHGDLRGSNILVDDHGSIRLTDFGMSVIAEATGYNYGSARGGAKRWLSPELISPEQFDMTSSRPAYASDVYAFSLTAIELYTGRPPFETLKEHQIIHRVLQGQRPPRPTIYGSDMSDPLWKVTTLCWRHHPSNRPTAAQVVHALKTSARHRL